MALAFAFGSVTNDREWVVGSISYNTGIGPQAGGFSTINEASAPRVKAAAKLLFFQGYFRVQRGCFSARAAAPARRKRRIRPPVPRSRPGTSAAPRGSGRRAGRPECRDRSRAGPAVAAVPAVQPATAPVPAAARAV